ncbi:hypothetical protein R1flu_016502 [Riccia fluitans]|uniref:Uncharacterized protein n=1 Tax=Riccia fluitans TaxID=41844 RepID=A0ABD1YM15_9MARC
MGGKYVARVSSSSGTMTSGNWWNHGKPVVPPYEFASGSSARAEKILRWNSREAEAEEEKKKVDAQLLLERRMSHTASAPSPKVYRSSSRTFTSSSTSLQRQQGRAVGKSTLVYMASPRCSLSQGLQSTPARQESSPLKRAESVRRRRSRISADFDSLHFSSVHHYNNNRLQQEQSTTSAARSVPSFEEILNQRTTISTSAAEATSSTTAQSPPEGNPKAVSDRVRDRDDSLISTSAAGVNPGRDGGLDMGSSRLIEGTTTGPDDSESSQNSKARKQGPELRSPLKGSSDSPLDDVEVCRHMLNRTEITDGFHGKKNASADHDHEGYAVDDSMESFRSCANTEAAGEESHTPSADDLKNQVGESSAVESSSVIFTPGRTQQLSRTQDPLKFEHDPLVSNRSMSGSALQAPEGSWHQVNPGASNSSLEKRHSVNRSAKASSNAARRQMIQLTSCSLKIDYSSGFRREESLSHSGPNAGQDIPKFTSLLNTCTPRARRIRTAVESKVPHSVRKALESSKARIPGLSKSSKALSVAEDVLEGSKSKFVSFGCRPPPLKPRVAPRAAPSSQNVGVTDLQKRAKFEARGRRAGYTTMQHLFIRISTLPAAASQARSFRKWVTDQFQLGGGRKLKDELVTTTSSPPSDQHLQEQIDCVDISHVAETSPLRVRLPQENFLRDAARHMNSETELLDHPQRELSRTSHTQNGDEIQATSGEHCLEIHIKKDHGVQRHNHHYDRKRLGSSQRVGSWHPSAKTQVVIKHSGPLKFEGYQHLFGADSSSSSSPSQHNGCQRDSNGETLKAMEFLDCSEVAELNEFLRAKRDSVTSCQRNGSGYLKFISTSNPIGLGSMICIICYSYFLEKRSKGPGRWSVVPLINFSRCRMRQHLDAAWLFHVCGLDVKALMFAKEVDIEGLSRDGVTTRTTFVGDQVLRSIDEIGSCCTLLAETFSRDADELWSSSGSILKTLLLAGLLVDTENLSKPTSSAITSRDHQMLLLLLAGSAPLDRFGLYERLRAVHTDAEVVSMARSHYGAAVETLQLRNTADDTSLQSSFPPRTSVAKKIMKNGTRNLPSPKESPLFSCSEADDYSRLFGSATSITSPWIRSHSSSSPDAVKRVLSESASRNFSSLSRLPAGVEDPVGSHR